MKAFSEFELIASPITPGLTVIEASAGTGKTYSISHLVPRLLLAGDLPDLSKLLLVTFTKDAARELAERVRQVLTQLAAPPAPDEPGRHPHVAALRPLLSDPAARTRLDRALVDLDLLAVSTIHAFCQRTLQQEGSLCGLPVMPEITADDRELLTTIVRAQWFATLAADPPLAALATARGWDLDTAIHLINSLRRCHHPQPEPATPPFAEMRGRLDRLATRIAAPGAAAGAIALIRQVTDWNTGVDDPESALAQLQPLQRGTLDTLAFWQSLDFARALPGKITARTKAAKALRAQLASDGWFTTINDLAALAKRLEWGWQHQLAAEAVPQLARLLESRRLITQDGLIGTLYRALHRPTPEGARQSARLADHLAERYHVALIDESQDTDPRQFAIFRRVFLDSARPRRLLLVGDPKQAIYGFRGADLATYLAARNGADRGYTLTHTHRAPPPLVATLNRLFERDRAFHHPGMMFRPAVSALACDRQLWRAGRPCSRLEAWVVPEEEANGYAAQGRRHREISARVATAIVDLLHEGELRTVWTDGRPEERIRVSPRDCAVLVSTNDQAEAMAVALQARNVPVVINSGADVFASDEAREFHRVLTALLDPRRTRRLRAALATRLLGLDAAALARLDEPADANSPPPDDWLERGRRWSQTWHARGLAALLAELEAPEIAVTHRLAVAPLTGERRATNYRHLTDLLLGAAREEAPRPAEVVRWLGQQIARATERSQVEERQLQLSSDREAVQIVTMHKAKGLEYSLVFCPYLADPLRPAKGIDQLPGAREADDGKSADVLVNLDLLEGEALAARQRELMAGRLEERLRLAYVALTRARVRVWVCSYGSKGKYDRGSPLDWLLRTDGEIAAFPEYSEAWVEAAKKERAARHTAALRALGAEPSEEGSAAEGRPAPAITFRAPPAAADIRFAPAAAEEGPGTVLAPLPPPRIPPEWKVTSFSTLTRERHAHGMPAAPTPGEESAAAGADAGSPPPMFLTAPGGATVGTVVHDWIETWDLGPPDPAALERHLAMARLPPVKAGSPGWRTVLGELFATLREIRLPGCGDTPLQQICPEIHGSEWHFHLPLAGTLTAGDFAHCFEQHAAPEHRPYAHALRALPDDRFQGLLQGFIDRLVRCGPAWGVIDWKTNRLGPSLGDYDAVALLRCATEDHYLLQTHLYLVALRRYLRALGLAEPPIAGAWLVFLRAIAPGETRGVLRIDPPREMLDALDQLFAPAVCTAP